MKMEKIDFVSQRWEGDVEEARVRFKKIRDDFSKDFDERQSLLRKNHH
tara:strand:- start:164 stop:307 length:144 start_codon:yes stop_codon:yes gene_type:complete